MRFIIDLWTHHGTKLLGFAQVTAGALAIADPALIGPVFGENGVRYILLASGLLTAWRGFMNTQQATKVEP